MQGPLQLLPIPQQSFIGIGKTGGDRRTGTPRSVAIGTYTPIPHEEILRLRFPLSPHPTLHSETKKQLPQTQTCTPRTPLPSYNPPLGRGKTPDLEIGQKHIYLRFREIKKSPDQHKRSEKDVGTTDTPSNDRSETETYLLELREIENSRDQLNKRLKNFEDLKKRTLEKIKVNIDTLNILWSTNDDCREVVRDLKHQNSLRKKYEEILKETTEAIQEVTKKEENINRSLDEIEKKTPYLYRP